MSLISDERVEELLANEKERDAEIERLKDKIRGLEKLNQMTDEEVVMELKAEIERLKSLVAACAAILERRVPVTADFIGELRRAAE